MKLIIYAFLFIVNSSHCLFANKTVSLEGSISKSYDGSKVTLSYNGRTNSTNSAFVKTGKFQLALKLSNEYELVYLVFERGEKTLGAISFFAGSGKITVTVNTKNGLISENDISLTNAVFAKEKKTYEIIQKVAGDSLSNLFNKLSNLRKAKSSSMSYDSLLTVYRSKRKEFMDQSIIFFKTHSDQFISLFYFHEKVFDNSSLYYPVDTLLQVYYQFPEQLRNTSLGISSLNYLLKRKSLALQSEMPDFSIKTIEGKLFQLSSFREKQFVLLCFWASWCGPCIKSIPFLKQVDSLYSKEGLKMISISIDNDVAKWTNSLEKHKPTWVQGCDLVPYVEHDKAIRPLYDLRFIPQYFLIDKQGSLIYHNLQLNDGDDLLILQSTLIKIFKN
jgi:thiol-disulfide isomerase/thioredoxin